MRLIDTNRHRALVTIVVAIAVCATVMFLASCEDPAEPESPSSISIFVGNNQYSKVGTELELPLTVIVRYSGGQPASGSGVRFEVIDGGGSLSRSTDTADDAGVCDSRLTLGPSPTTNRVRASLTSDPDISVTFTATASQFYCPEEDPNFQRRFNTAGELFLLTNHSSLFLETGIVKIVPQFTPTASAVTSPLVSFPVDLSFRTVPRDAQFSRSGEFYVMQTQIFPEVIKVNPNTTSSIFSLFEDEIYGAEFARSPGAILMGCDIRGPFAVGCRDTLFRFEEASYGGNGADRCNADAMAVDLTTQDLFYIYLGDNTLRRLPLDSLNVTGSVEIVANLTLEEAEGARGMIVNDDGNRDVFILVDSQQGLYDPVDDQKLLLRVTQAGTRTTEFDFKTRAGGPGQLSDLALNPAGGGLLYTVDTLGDMLLVWDLTQQLLVEMPPNPTLSDPESISTTSGGMPDGGERVGLVVLP